jgi:hypothetical protein
MGGCYINVQFFAINCCKLFLTVLNCTKAIKAWKLPQHRRTHEIQTKDGLDWTAAGIGGSVCVNRLWPVEAGGGGMTKDEALDLALEALEWMVANDDTNEGDEPVERLGGQSWNEYNAYWLDGLNNSRAAITAIKQARAAPTVQEPVAWRYTDSRGHYRYRGYVPGFDVEYSLLKPQALYTTPPAQPAVPDAIIEAGESPEFRDGWNECRETILQMLKARKA